MTVSLRDGYFDDSDTKVRAAMRRIWKDYEEMWTRIIDDGQAVAQGLPADVLTPQRLEPVYGVKLVTLATSDDPSRKWVVPIEQASEAAP